MVSAHTLHHESNYVKAVFRDVYSRPRSKMISKVARLQSHMHAQCTAAPCPIVPA